jgi:hypothetical protein
MRRAAAFTLLPLVVTLIACTGGDGGTARVRFTAVGWAQDGLSGLQIEFEDATEVRSVGGAALELTTDYAQPHSDWFDTPTEQVMTIRFSLARAGQRVAHGDIELDLRDDWEWEVQFHLAADDPADRCFGCIGSRGFAIDGEEGLRVFVVWGGNSISDPVVY